LANRNAGLIDGKRSQGILMQAASTTDTGIIVNDLMMQTLRTADSVSATLDGRVR
jgi:hypothetical protein